MIIPFAHDTAQYRGWLRISRASRGDEMFSLIDSRRSTMSVIRFDEAWLKSQLQSLPQPSCIAFAAACTERIFPCLRHYSEKAAGDDSLVSPFMKGLELAWSAAAWSRMNPNEMESITRLCENRLLSEDEAFDAGVPCAEDASACVVYTLRLAMTADIRNAVWVATVLYDYVDNFALASLDLGGTATLDEGVILSSRIVQDELARQKRDLSDLRSGMEDPTRLHELHAALRLRARIEATDLFPALSIVNRIDGKEQG